MGKCPKCGGILNWITIGYDEFGAIKVLECSNAECMWREDDDDESC